MIGGFRKECENCLNSVFYDHAIASFDKLPIAAVMNDSTFCIHPGFSPTIQSRADLFATTKPTPTPEIDLLSNYTSLADRSVGE
jgi:diadenosine tetraphosphatase ApaH/serine/threonine PP2A family protein phosphatase